MTRTALAAFTLAVATLAAAPAFAADEYDLKTTDASVAPGGKGVTSVTIAAKGGWHINEEAPITLSLTPDAGLTLPKAKLAREDLAVKSKEAPRFDVAFTAPGEAGKKVINAEAKFVLCQETACKPVKQKLALNVDVAAAAPAPAATHAAPKKK